MTTEAAPKVSFAPASVSADPRMPPPRPSSAGASRRRRPATSSSLRASPRYGACEAETRRQRDAIGRVRTMSDDLDMDNERIDDEPCDLDRVIEVGDGDESMCSNGDARGGAEKEERVRGSDGAGREVSSPQINEQDKSSAKAKRKESRRKDSGSSKHTGRCVHHPHVRLRKRRLLGRGWKVLMTACTDCCAEELRRMNFAEDDSAATKERSSDEREKDKRTFLGGKCGSGRAKERHSSERRGDGRGFSGINNSNNGSNQNQQPRSSICNTGGDNGFRALKTGMAMPPSPSPSPSRRSQSQEGRRDAGNVRINASKARPPKRSASQGSSKDVYAAPIGACKARSTRRSSSQETSCDSFNNSNNCLLWRRSASQDKSLDASVSRKYILTIIDEGRSRMSGIDDGQGSTSSGTASLTDDSSESSDGERTVGDGEGGRGRPPRSGPPPRPPVWSSSRPPPCLPRRSSSQESLPRTSLAGNSAALASPERAWCPTGGTTPPAGVSRGADAVRSAAERRSPERDDATLHEKHRAAFPFNGNTPRDATLRRARTDHRRVLRLQPKRPHGTMYAVQLPYVDTEGRSATYTGQVNDRSVPHGEGSMKYDLDGGVVNGEWEDGQHRRGSDVNEGGRKKGSSRSRSGSRKGEQSRRPSVAQTRTAIEITDFHSCAFGFT